MDKNSISVIIPSFNGYKLLKEYLPYTFDVVSHSRSVSDFEIIVIDDASTDETVAYINTLDIPNLILIVNDVNSGFSKTINKGIARAKMDYCLLLNNDMELPTDFFEQTLPLFSDDSVFGVCTEIRDRAGERIIEGRKLPFFKHHELRYHETIDAQNGNTFYLCGGNAVVDTRKIQNLNGFNELFAPFYFEDLDLSLRAWRKGWKCLYINSTYCKHTPSSTIRKENDNLYVNKIFVRNRMLLNYLHNSWLDNTILMVRICVKCFWYRFYRNAEKRNFIESAKGFFAVKKEANRCREKEYELLNPLDLTVFK